MKLRPDRRKRQLPLTLKPLWLWVAHQIQGAVSDSVDIGIYALLSLGFPPDLGA